MVLNNLNTNKILYQFLGRYKTSRNNYINFFYKRNSFNIFKTNGNFNITKHEFSVIRYLKHLMQAKKKWKNYQYKKRYLGKKTYKKSFARVKAYIQKNFLTEYEKYHTKVKVIVNQESFDILAYETLESPIQYTANIFEIIYLKMRFLKTNSCFLDI